MIRAKRHSMMYFWGLSYFSFIGFLLSDMSANWKMSSINNLVILCSKINFWGGFRSDSEIILTCRDGMKVSRTKRFFYCNNKSQTIKNSLKSQSESICHTKRFASVNYPWTWWFYYFGVLISYQLAQFIARLSSHLSRVRKIFVWSQPRLKDAKFSVLKAFKGFCNLV